MLESKGKAPLEVAAKELLIQAQLDSAPASGKMEGNALNSPTEVDDEAAAAMRARAQGRGRRAVVFSAPVKVDENDDWTPRSIEKTDAERAQIDGVLRANILFGGLDDDTRTVLVNAMDRKAFTAGDVVIRQGDPGDFYYCIAEGSADVLVADKVVLSVGPGKGFGELALLYDSPRAATVIATSPALACWAIDRETFKHVTIGRCVRRARPCHPRAPRPGLTALLLPPSRVSPCLSPLAAAWPASGGSTRRSWRACPSCPR